MRALVTTKGNDFGYSNVDIQKMSGTIIDPNGDGEERIKDDRYMVYDVGGNTKFGYQVLADKQAVKDAFDFHPTEQVDPRAYDFIKE